MGVGNREMGEGGRGKERHLGGGRFVESAKCGGIQSQVAAAVAGQWQYPSDSAAPRPLARVGLSSPLFYG